MPDTEQKNPGSDASYNAQQDTHAQDEEPRRAAITFTDSTSLPYVINGEFVRTSDGEKEQRFRYLATPHMYPEPICWHIRVAREDEHIYTKELTLPLSDGMPYEENVHYYQHQMRLRLADLFGGVMAEDEAATAPEDAVENSAGAEEEVKYTQSDLDARVALERNNVSLHLLNQLIAHQSEQAKKYEKLSSDLLQLDAIDGGFQALKDKVASHGAVHAAMVQHLQQMREEFTHQYVNYGGTST